MILSALTVAVPNIEILKICLSHGDYYSWEWAADVLWIVLIQSRMTMLTTIGVKIFVQNVFKIKTIALLFLRMNSRWTLDPALWRKMHGSKPPNLVVWRIVSLRRFLIFLCFYKVSNDSPPKLEGYIIFHFSLFEKKWCYPH